MPVNPQNNLQSNEKENFVHESENKSNSSVKGTRDSATEQKRAEKVLNIELEQFSDLFLHAPINSCIWKGKNYVFEMTNDLFKQTFGKNDIIGKPLLQVFPELAEQGIIELLDEVYATGQSYSGKEMPVKVNRNGDGEMLTIYVNSIYQPYKNSKGQIDGIFFFGTNVTEHVLARKKTQESEKKYSDLIQNLPAAIYTSDAEGRVMLYNKAAANLWGCAPQIGIDYWCKDCKTYKADGTLIPFDISPMALTLIERRPIFGEEIIIESINGDNCHVLPYSTPTYDSYGNLTGAVNMLIDITDRKKTQEELHISNERFETVIKATNDAIWEWNLVTGNVYHNTSYERIFGYPVKTTTQNMEQWIEKIHDKDRDRVRKSIMQKITDADTGNWQTEYRYIKANGEIADVIDRGFIIVNDNNKPVRFVGAMQDITERKKTEIEREYLIEQLIRNNQDLQQFTYITSHNLRAPLSNLIGLLNNVDTESLNDFNRNMFQMFKSSTQQLHQTINDLNQILIIKNNKNLEVQNINIEEVFKNVCGYFIDEIEKLPVTIVTDFQCKEIPFNKSYLESVLTNLISNSIKYRFPGRPLQLHITAKKEKGVVSLTFTDNGRGIDLKRNKDKIFGLYQRFHSNTDGVGFGLFITKTQITSFGGTVDAESEVDKGTAFNIRFKEKSESDTPNFYDKF
jgi:PAS domain S-box-containing protein